tara:strand:+ start:240 stop:482 length:243 start_codon:yes stop_codon:yes gene_type:complete
MMLMQRRGVWYGIMMRTISPQHKITVASSIIIIFLNASMRYLLLFSFLIRFLMILRAQDFGLGWFADPLYFGDWPASMKV